jgi:hypothetical protein
LPKQEEPRVPPRSPIHIIALAACAASFCPGIGRASPLVTIVQGEGGIVSSGVPYRAVPGAKLRGCDVVRTGAQSLVQVEFEDDSVIALGGEGSGFVTDVPVSGAAGGTVHALVSGWAKLTAPQEAKPVLQRLNTPHFDVVLKQGVAVVRVDDKAGELFVERGSATVLTHPDAREVEVGAGRFFATAATGPAFTITSGVKKPFLEGMPRAFRDTLPARRKSFEGRETAPVRSTGSAAQEALPLSVLPELRACLAAVPVRRAQEALKRLGIAVGPIDGIRGPLTEAALREFQRQRGLRPSGQLDPETLSALDEVARR